MFACVGTIAFFTLLGAAACVGVWFMRREVRRKRWEYLYQRFGPEIGARILDGALWQGQTQEMLVESIGSPVEVATEVLKSRTRHVLKYKQTGHGRFALKITLEDGVVVGWDQK